jgi:hypothetical protein
MIIKKNKLILITGILLFISISFYYYQYHYKFYYGEALNYIVADSKFYIEFSNKINSRSDLIGLLSINKNLFGIIFYYNVILRNKRIYFYFVTTIFLIIATKSIYKNIPSTIKKGKIIFLIFVNPALLTTLSGPNKEIVGFISILFLLNYLLNNKIKYVIFSLLFALFTRFELLMVILIFIMFIKFEIKTRKILGLLMIVTINILIYLYPNNLYSSFDVRESSLGFVSNLNYYGALGFYFLTYIPKLLLNLFGELVTLNVFSLKGYSLYIYLSQFLFFLLTIFIIKKKRINFRNDFFCLIYIYSLVFTTPPFIQHRYFLPIYPVFILLLFYRKDKKILLKEKR